MRHRVKKLQIPEYDLKNLTTSVLLYEKVSTTKNRAKAVKQVLDRLISRAKSRETVQAIRYLNRFLVDNLAVQKVMQVLVKRYESRDSGYTRIIPTHNRKGDAAPMVTIMLLP